MLVCVRGVRGEVVGPGITQITLLYCTRTIYCIRSSGRRGAELRCVDAIGRHATKIGIAHILDLSLENCLAFVIYSEAVRRTTPRSRKCYYSNCHSQRDRKNREQSVRRTSVRPSVKPVASHNLLGILR